jgi:hypothetical protein
VGIGVQLCLTVLKVCMQHVSAYVHNLFEILVEKKTPYCAYEFLIYDVSNIPNIVFSFKINRQRTVDTSTRNAKGRGGVVKSGVLCGGYERQIMVEEGSAERTFC